MNGDSIITGYVILTIVSVSYFLILRYIMKTPHTSSKVIKN